jgi:DNA polymerase
MKILVIAEAPGEQEDKQNTQLIGSAGQLLREALIKFGVDLDRDCRKTNAVRCRPPDNRKPTGKEMAACRSHIDEEIKANPPKLILLLGQTALESFLLGQWDKTVGTIGRWRGWSIPNQKFNCWVCPVFHPSYILREDDQAVENTFVTDLENALQTVRIPLPILIPDIIQIDSLTAIQTLLQGGERTIAIDYETTGLRPYYKGHKIVSCGICTGDQAWAFPMTREVAPLWKQVLQSKKIKKIGHNIKFETSWARHCLGVETEGWLWDTMIAAHLIDNRRDITSLKFQAFVNFGSLDYSVEVSHLLKSDGGKEGFNALKSEPPSAKLLHYNALDAYFAYWLAKKQWQYFK